MYMARNRNFVFTWNNYTEDSEQFLRSRVDEGVIKYVGYCKEIAPSTGTPHLQGFCSFENKKSVQQVRAILVGCHVETMLGSISQNEDYCSKAGELINYGVQPVTNDNKGRAEQLRWQRARESAKLGQFDDIDADIFIRCYSTLKRIRTDYTAKPPPEDVTCYWIYGPTGTGKSHSVETTFPLCYKKNMDDPKWFDGYQGEETVYLEDIDKYQVKWGGLLKRLADRWPLLVNTKGSMQYIRPKRIIVTSNYNLDEIWSDSGTLDPLLRRFTVILKESQEQVIDFT
uniref:Replication-associated protein n=2 Tax=Lake Sarah-associated circular virus-39 TaxID=1685767 RepID=A0A140AQQ1_9VIRU|nr:replication associated protein [Lake Sarah-associated circular virus-39]